MGLDQFAGRHTWRKHARLQKFMATMWEQQNPGVESESNGFGLGFNAGDLSLIHI